MRRSVFGLLLCVAMLVAWAPPAGAASSHDLKGMLTLTESSDGWAQSNTGCSGSSGYDDITAGAQVRVKDGNGHLLGVSKLGKGVLDKSNIGYIDKLVHACLFGFKVKGVPETKFYSVEVSHRGELAYSLADLKRVKWTVELTLGS